MYRSIPVQNKIIAQKIHDHEHQLHLKKIQNMKSSINTKGPEKYKHLEMNKKKIQIREDYLSEIERENRILLNKLTTILKASPSRDPNNSSSHPILPIGKSLNKNLRKRELVRITIENQMISKRLQDKKSAYSVENLIEDKKIHDKYLKNICEFPLNLYNNQGYQQESSTRYNNFELSEMRPQTFDSKRVCSEKYFNSTNKIMENENDIKKPSSQGGDWNSKKRIQKLDPIVRIQSTASHSTFYQGKRKIGFSNFSVEIYSDQTYQIEDYIFFFKVIYKNFIIQATNLDRYDSIKKLIVSPNEGLKLLQKFHNNYEKMANAIKFEGNKIILSDDDDFKVIKSEILYLLKNPPKNNEKNLDKDNDIVEIPSDNDNENSEESIILYQKQEQNTSENEEETKEVEKIFPKIRNNIENHYENEVLIDTEDVSHEINLNKDKIFDQNGDIKETSNNIKNSTTGNFKDEAYKIGYLSVPDYDNGGLQHISENEEENEYDASARLDILQKHGINVQQSHLLCILHI